MDARSHAKKGHPVTQRGLSKSRIMSGLQCEKLHIWSVRRVIWFQDDFAFPIAERVQQQIAEIDWEAHATSWEP